MRPAALALCAMLLLLVGGLCAAVCEVESAVAAAHVFAEPAPPCHQQRDGQQDRHSSAHLCNDHELALPVADELGAALVPSAHPLPGLLLAMALDTPGRALSPSRPPPLSVPLRI